MYSDTKSRIQYNDDDARLGVTNSLMQSETERLGYSINTLNLSPALTLFLLAY